MSDREVFEAWAIEKGYAFRVYDDFVARPAYNTGLMWSAWQAALAAKLAPAQGADARPVAMTNGSFHCPACGETMKGPLACGHCLWQKPEAVDAEIGADGIATRDATPVVDARPVAIYQEQDCSGHWIDIPRIRYNMIPNPLWKRIVYATRTGGDHHE